MDQELHDYTGDRQRQRQQLSAVPYVTDDRGLGNSLSVSDETQRNMVDLFLSRAAYLKSRSEFLCERWPLVAPAARADAQPSRGCEISYYRHNNEKESSGGPSRSLSRTHTQTYLTPLSSLNHTPHKLSKHVGAVKVSLMAIYCVLYASH